MHVTLTCSNTSTQEAVEAELEIGERVVVGRQLGSPLMLQGEALSRQHFTLSVVDDQLMVENLSSNGTRINGVSLPLQESSPVQSGDFVEVPGYQIRIEVREAAQDAIAGEGKSPAWQAYGTIALKFFDPLEITLAICSLACIGIFVYYIAT
jgi:predicted component of type VI protein secretion system